MTLHDLDDVILEEARKANRVWFWKPQWYWHGWTTLLPAYIGHDEYARRTLLIGWTVTGRIIIALGDCGRPECKTDAYTWANDWLDSERRS